MFCRAVTRPARLRQKLANTKRRRRGAIGLLSPSLILVLGVFVAPLGIMLWRAFTDPEVGFGNFTWYLTDAVQHDVLVRTFTTALIVTVVCLVVGYPFAYAMVAFGPKVRAVLTLMILVPFWTSLMVRTFAWVILLQDNGPVHSVFKFVGLEQVRADPHQPRRGHRHESNPAAVHGLASVRRDGDHRPSARPGIGEPWRAATHRRSDGSGCRCPCQE